MKNLFKLILINFIVFFVLMIFVDLGITYVQSLPKPEPPKPTVTATDKKEDNKEKKPAPTSGYVVPYIADDILGIRPNPARDDHNEEGWRNTEVLNSVDIVALGDSQTYGVNAWPEQAWPQTLSEISKKSVYQMAYGTYSPAHYPLYFEEVKQKQPKYILAAYYFGNDNADAFGLAIHHKNKKLGTSLEKEELSELSMKARDIDPDFGRYKNLDCQVPRMIKNPAVQNPLKVLEQNQRLAASTTDPYYFLQYIDLRSAWYFLNSSLHQNSSIYKILYRYFHWTMPSLPPYAAPVCIQYNKNKFSTLLTPAYRLIGLTTTDPRIIDGEKINLESLSWIQKQSKAIGAKLLVVLIPTKERIYQKVIDHEGSSLKSKSYSYIVELWKSERSAIERVSEYLNENNIEFIDTTKALQRSFDKGLNPYNNLTRDPRHSGDGHPNAHGYKAIAEAISEKLFGNL